MHIYKLNATANTQMADKIISLSYFNTDIEDLVFQCFKYMLCVFTVHHWCPSMVTGTFYMVHPLLRCISTVVFQAESPLKLPAE